MQKKKVGQGQSNILVAIRIRPLNQKQVNSDDWDVIRVQDNLMIILDPIQMQFEAENKKMLEVLHRSKEQRYAFDKIYRDHSGEQIYEQTVKPLIRKVINGCNATVFAYGPTGTGKTHTMLGNQQTYGLNVLAIKNIFDQIKRDDEFQYTIIITYVEIYNQMIRDLLVPSSGYLQLRDDPQKGIVISSVTQCRAQSTEQVMNLLLMGNKRRTTQATNANQTSSRSHAVFQINVSKVPKTKNTNVQTLVGKLSLIDLAGSQRGTVTQNRGIRLMQGAKINRSLLALANCINALGDKNKKGFFVPYRDSKLTRLLKDSLGGNCKTVMIATVSPASSQFEQTINTLKYANRAKNIKTKVLTNKKLVSIHISQYKNIINDLRTEIQTLKLKLSEKGNYQSQNPIINASDLENKKNQRKVTDGVPCSCGRGQEQQQMKKIQQQIFQNFNQRIQIRRALMQIQQQNALNVLEIKRKQGEIILLKKSQGNEDDIEGKKIADQIKMLTKSINTLKLSTNKNMLKKQIMNLQLMESMTSTKKIRDQIAKRIKFRNNRQFLQMVIKNHVFELQNIQLQINLQIQQKIIGDLKSIVTAQKKSLQDHGVDTIKIEDQFIDNQQIQLQIDEDADLNDDEDEQQQQLQLQNYKLEVQNNKQKIRMNQHFDNKNKQPSQQIPKRDKSANKNFADKKSLENIKLFENPSDQQQDRRSDKKKQKKPGVVLPQQFSGMGIVGQTALKQVSNMQVSQGKKQKQIGRILPQKTEKQRQKTIQKVPLQFNLKGKNILLPNINPKDKKRKP